jgi:hypothetical protein
MDRRSQANEEERRAIPRKVPDLAEGRDSGSTTDFEASIEDGRDAAEAPPAEELGEMGGLDRSWPTDVKEERCGQGGRERTGCAHAEPLADRQGGMHDRADPSWAGGTEVFDGLGRDRQVLALFTRDVKTTASTRFPADLGDRP